MSASDSGSHTSGVVTWNNITVPATGSKTLTVVAKLDDNLAGGTIITNTAAVDGTTAQDQTTVQSNNANVTIVISDNPDPVRPSNTLTYTVRITNLNSSAANDLQVRTTIDNDTTYLSSSDNGSHANGVVTWNNVDIPANGSVTRTLAVRVDNNANDGDILRINGEVIGTNATDEETTRVDDDNNSNNDDDLSISVTDRPDPVEPGQILVYDIRVCNESDQDDEFDITAFLDNDTSFIDASDGGDDVSSDEVEWEDIDIDENSCETLKLDVRVRTTAEDGDSLRLRVRSGDEEDTENTRVEDDGFRPPLRPPLPPIGPPPVGPGGPLQLTVQKHADRSEVQPGSTASYTVTIRNPSPEPVQNITVEDQFTAGTLSIEDAAGGNVLGNTITWNIPVLGPNATRVLHYRVRVDHSMRHGQVISNSVVVRSPDIAGSATDTAQVRVIEHLPQTGIGGFVGSLAKVDSYVRPVARAKVVRETTTQNNSASASDAALPFIIWTNIIAIGISGGWLFGRRLVF